MKRAILVMTLVAVSGVAQAQVVGSRHQVAPMPRPDRPPWQTGDQFYPSAYPSSVHVSPSLSQPIDWMRGIPRSDTWVAYRGWGTPTASIAQQPPRHRAATYGYYPNYPEASHSQIEFGRQPTTTSVHAPLVTPYHDPFFEERFWEDLEDGEVSEWWGW